MQDLNDLYYFAMVVDHGGFAAAERALGIPKSRLSRRITQLETDLGVRLFVGRADGQHSRKPVDETLHVGRVVVRLRYRALDGDGLFGEQVHGVSGGLAWWRR